VQTILIIEQGSSTMNIPYLVKKLIPGYVANDVKILFKRQIVEIYLQKSEDNSEPLICSRCGRKLAQKRGSHQMKIKHLPIFGLDCYLIFYRQKANCPHCKKARSEHIDFLARETPHLSKEYSWWLGRLTEISTVSRVAELTGNDQNTLWRIDYDRLVLMLQNYKIPDVKRISVDEVHARSKRRYSRENRNKQYFTVVSDLDTGRVIWVSNNREKEALDEFYTLLGEERCSQIEVAAMDQFNGYKASTEQHCPQAKIVWDRFHLIRNFKSALNDERLEIIEKNKKEKKSVSNITGKFKYLFLKKAKKRTKAEVKSFKQVMRDNKEFYKLELIKERFFHFFNQRDIEDARDILIEVKSWIKENGFKYLENWVDNFVGGWEIVKNYFEIRVTSALSEGQNNVIKALKRRCFGFKNMTYFKLKIMQVCGYLNSRYISIDNY
jgi:transposase